MSSLIEHKKRKLNEVKSEELLTHFRSKFDLYKYMTI